MILYLIHHAESCHNAEGRVQGQSDVGLSDFGRRQAEALVDALEHDWIEAMHASPLRPALETAEPLARRKGVSIETDSRLEEIHVGVFQDHLHEELSTLFPAEYEQWTSGDPDFVIPGGESRRQLMDRAYAVFQAICDTGAERVAIVSHGSTLSAALKVLMGIPAHHHPFCFHNAAISRLEWSSRSTKLITFNEIAHLGHVGLAGYGDF